MTRIKAKDLPAIKDAMMVKQKDRCYLCGINLMSMAPKDICLDHDHKTGHIRAVLCRNCNGCEGKVFNLANRSKRSATPLVWLSAVIDYWMTDWTKINPLHHTHRTEEEKRLKRNKRAKKLRDAKKK